jgi:2'-5' RNA ligase
MRLRIESTRWRTSVSSYRRFIDDPKDIARFEGQRFVVLRATGAVQDVHGHVRSLLEVHLPAGKTSGPTEGHVTLAGFSKGTPLDSVLDVVSQWAQSVAPLRLEVEKAGYFPAPFQVVMLQIRRTPELVAALASLRARARERGLQDDGAVPASEWVFHMSLAYCSSLTSAAWSALTHVVAGLTVHAAQCVVDQAEIVAFDDGREYSGGIVALSGPAAPASAGPR